uniref:Uncharacterized protein n=1 Tax=Anguilla anguilla TaxID=7936 RepID=A0A0E9TUZ6_ANGAN
MFCLCAISMLHCYSCVFTHDSLFPKGNYDARCLFEESQEKNSLLS